MAPGRQEDQEEHSRRLSDAERPLLSDNTEPRPKQSSTLLTVCPFILGTPTLITNKRLAHSADSLRLAYQP